MGGELGGGQEGPIPPPPPPQDTAATVSDPTLLLRDDLVKRDSSLWSCSDKNYFSAWKCISVCWSKAGFRCLNGCCRHFSVSPDG